MTIGIEVELERGIIDSDNQSNNENKKKKTKINKHSKINNVNSERRNFTAAIPLNRRMRAKPNELLLFFFFSFSFCIFMRTNFSL